LLMNQPGKDYKLLPPPWPNIWHALIFAAPIFGVLIFAAPLMVALRPVCVKPDEPGKVVIVYKDKIVYRDKTVTEPNTTPVTNPHIKPDIKPTVTLQADQWSWLQYIDIADQLKEGVVVVLMYHHDCPICAKMVPLYSEYCQKMKELGDESMKIAFVAVPPYSDKGPVPADTVCLRGKLTEKDEQKFAIMSPYVVALIDGQFVKAWKQGTAPEPDKILDEIFAQPEPK
jgi:hypothetical protein